MSRSRGLAGLLARGLPRRGGTASALSGAAEIPAGSGAGQLPRGGSGGDGLGVWVVGQVALAGGIALVASAFVTVVLSTARLHVPYWQLWLVITGLFLLQWLLMPAGEPPPAADPDPVEDAGLTDRPYPQVDRWERRLSVTSGDPEWYSRVVRDRLAGLVAERLRQRHGVAMTTDPGRARVILGEELYEFLTAPLTRTPDQAGLSRLITRIEEV